MVTTVLKVTIGSSAPKYFLYPKCRLLTMQLCQWYEWFIWFWKCWCRYIGSGIAFDSRNVCDELSAPCGQRLQGRPNVKRAWTMARCEVLVKVVKVRYSVLKSPFGRDINKNHSSDLDFLDFWAFGTSLWKATMTNKVVKPSNEPAVGYCKSGYYWFSGLYWFYVFLLIFLVLLVLWVLLVYWVLLAFWV